ncbi:response regulator [Aeromicrobium ponti]|uniref:Two-component system response regulator YesN n=1 Tax=Cytobacillus oceanisediminis TaxID=665099 RepID=A0A562JRD4_9BACI|nr:response regulator [Cytobacillus oceanisediminis]TWH85716.1 two-component system response regulator YesN [Cytobacillus oceanisediminis]
MYKVIIVDDEDIISEGISTFMPWDELGFELVGVAGNGKEALELFKRGTVDVMITDICMPIMDGIELTQEIKRISSPTKVIILSGYDEFEYAQSALKMGVLDYILKPITPNELKSLLSKVKEKLDQEERETKYLDSLKKQVQENLPILRERFLNELIYFSMPEDQIRNKCDNFSLSLAEPPYAALLIKLNREGLHPDEIQLYQYALTDVCSRHYNEDKGKIVFANTHGETVMIMACRSKESFQEEVFRATEPLKQIISEKLKAPVSIGAGNPVAQLQDLPASYEEALSALDYRFLLGNGQILFISDLENRTDSFNQPVELEKKLMTSLKVGKIEETHQLIEKIFFELQQADIDRSKLYIMELIVILNKTLYELGMKPKQIWDESFLTIDELLNHRTLAQIKDWLKEISWKVNECISQRRDHTSKQYMEQTKNYILEHFSDKNLTLTSICNYLHVSTSYFSILFKKEMNMTFGEYLSKVRMEEAKKLLKISDYKAYEIAEMVGYNDQYYFSTVFKKQIGLSPTEFRSIVTESVSKPGGD